MNIKHLSICIFALILISLFSCSKDDVSLINPSSSQLNFEGEGGQESISFKSGNWKIKEVINQDNNHNVFGNIYSSDGKLIEENKVLRLDGLGSLEAIWSDKGFTIERDVETSMIVRLDENFTKENFGFIIYLESGNETKQVSVNQKPSQGYEIKSIKYTIGSSGRDSIFVEKGNIHSFNNNSSEEHSLLLEPFNGVFEFSQFVSNEKGAYPWTQTDSTMVEVPTQIIDDEVITNDRKSPYSNEITKKESRFKENTVEINIPQGQFKFVVELEYRKRRVSYTLQLMNNRTNENKIITGEWIETAPTGNFKINWL